MLAKAKQTQHKVTVNVKLAIALEQARQHAGGVACASSVDGAETASAATMDAIEAGASEKTATTPNAGRVC